MITPEMENEYFVSCEVLDPNLPVFHTGGIKRNDNGYGSETFVTKYSEKPCPFSFASEEQTENAHKSFDNAKNYYEHAGFRVFHLKKGIKVSLENNLNPPFYAEGEDAPDFIQVWIDWWENEYLPYIARFMTEEEREERAKNLSSLADALDNASKN